MLIGKRIYKNWKTKTASSFNKHSKMDPQSINYIRYLFIQALLQQDTTSLTSSLLKTENGFTLMMKESQKLT